MRKYHVLVVDDNPDIRRLIRTTLGDTFYRVGEAANGGQAFDYLEQNDYPDLIILDLAMPDISGLDVLKQLRGDPDTVALEVIVLSANADERSASDARNLGVRTILTKPFSPLELLETVEKLFS